MKLDKLETTPSLEASHRQADRGHGPVAPELHCPGADRASNRSKAEAIFAGTEPGARVHPEVLAAMQEAGIDLSNAKPQKLTEELAQGASLLITLGCGDKCPYVPGLRRDDWPLMDPKGLPMDEVRSIRDDIRGGFLALLKTETSNDS